MKARKLNEDIVPGYRVKFRIGDAWSQAQKLDVTDEDQFDEFKSLIMPKVRRLYKKMKTYMEDKDQVGELKQIIRDLSAAHDADDWDFAWDDFYDWCDDNGVWVDAKDGEVSEA